MRKTLTHMETRAYTKNPNLHGKPYLNAKPAPIAKTLTCMKHPHLKEKPYPTSRYPNQTYKQPWLHKLAALSRGIALRHVNAKKTRNILP